MLFKQMISKISVIIFIFFLIIVSANNSFCQIGFTQTGNASFYAAKFNGRKTSSGETFNNNAFTAAHRELAFNTMLRVTNLGNNKSVIVRVNDRGPFKKQRILDLSRAAAEELDIIRHGTAYVKIEVIGENGTTDKTVSDNQVAKNEKNNNDIVKNNNNSSFSTGKTYSVWGTEKFPKGYCVQLFAFKELDNAKEKCKELINNNLEEAFIQVGWEHHSKIYRVMYGSFDGRHEAKNFKETLKRRGYKGFIKKHFNN